MNCPSCSAPVGDDWRFCQACGYALDRGDRRSAEAAATQPRRGSRDRSTARTAPAQDRSSVGDGLFSPGDMLPVGDFRVVRELGRGGFGLVYLVRAERGSREFAAKLAVTEHEEKRQSLLSELRIWMSLPEHPHLVPCRFFRTSRDQVFIFADAISGGSLAEWIRAERLTSLKETLDVAIQIGWGLEVAHRQGGIIHQDVKPDNILMTDDGLAKVNDFGISSMAPTRKGRDGAAVAGSGFLSPYHCSPEQADGAKIDVKTDVWSWAVTVLEMFTGGVAWGSGRLAGVFLEQWLDVGYAEAGRPRVPRPVADLLRRCLRENPAERWNPSDGVSGSAGVMGQIAEELLGIYERICNESYRWKFPSAVDREPPVPDLASLVVIGVPRAIEAWRGEQLQTSAIDDRSRISWHQSPRSKVIERLGAYPDIEHTVKEARSIGIAGTRAAACIKVDKARCHQMAGDRGGAIAEYDRAIALCESQSEIPRDVLVAALLEKGWLLRAGNRSADADRHQQRGIDILRVASVSGADVGHSSVSLHLSGALALVEMGRCSEADRWLASIRKKLEDQPSLDRAVMLLAEARCLVAARDEPTWERGLRSYGAAVECVDSLSESANGDAIRGVTVTMHLEVARAYQRVGIDDNQKLIDTFNVIDELDKHGPLPLSARQRADIDLKRVELHRRGGFFAEAIPFVDRVVRSLEAAIYQEGHYELEEWLSNAYAQKSDVLRERGRMREAIQTSHQAITLAERLERDGLAKPLTMPFAVRMKANAIAALGKPGQAITLYEQAEILRARGSVDAASLAASAERGQLLVQMAACLWDLGRRDEAHRALDDCIELLTRLTTEARSRSLAAGILLRAHIKKGQLNLISGRHQTAQEHFQHAVQATYRAGSYGNLHQAYRALAHCGEAIALLLQGKSESARSTAGDSLQMLEHYTRTVGTRELKDGLRFAQDGLRTLC